MTRAGKIIAVATLALAAFGIWWLFFPGDQRVIRSRVEKIARLASVGAGESQILRVSKTERLVDMLAADVGVSLEGTGADFTSFAGKDQFAEGLRVARLRARQAKVQLLDVVFDSEPDGQQAVTRMAALAEVDGEQNRVAQEIRISWRKVDGQWLIAKIETVKSRR
ncbi:MAG TPA: hypothetical protein VHH73_04500 [Verrucomicrobiae bacterium]|nr:hypothetical protein [Verrucomicrobiae bacterium]